MPWTLLVGVFFVFACDLDWIPSRLLVRAGHEPTPDELKMTSDSAARIRRRSTCFARKSLMTGAGLPHYLRARKNFDREGQGRVQSNRDSLREGITDGISNFRRARAAPLSRMEPLLGLQENLSIKSWSRSPHVRNGQGLLTAGYPCGQHYRIPLSADQCRRLFHTPAWNLQKSSSCAARIITLSRPTSIKGLCLPIRSGIEDIVSHLLFSPLLPPGAKVVSGQDSFDLVVDNIPAAPDEPYMPPLSSFNYRVIFYYTPYPSQAQFWATEGEYWSKGVKIFAELFDRIRAGVAKTVAPGDSDEQKLREDTMRL